MLTKLEALELAKEWVNLYRAACGHYRDEVLDESRSCQIVVDNLDAEIIVERAGARAGAGRRAQSDEIFARFKGAGQNASKQPQDASGPRSRASEVVG